MFRPILIALSLLFSSSLTVRNQSDKPINLTVPGAPWTLTLPGKHLSVERQQIKPDGRYGYFLLSDPDNQITLSLFIEPVNKCKTSKECRDMVWKAGNPNWENPQNVIMGEIGEVSLFEFLMPSYRGLPIRQQHMYAQFVVDAFWVDMHISKTQFEPQQRKLFEEIIKSVKFEPKKEKVAAASDSSEDAARKVADDWMLLWDAGSHDRAYEQLAEESKTGFTPRQWYVLWYASRKPLGNVKTRKLTKVSEGNGPNVRLVTYETVFDSHKDTVRETLALRLESGTWRVITYINNLDLRR